MSTARVPPPDVSMKTEERTALVDPARGHDVFVSYSRADRDRVLAFTQGLAERGKRSWVDLEDIPPSAEWMAEIRSAIEGADGYLVVVSPALSGSPVCAEELEYARAAGKRIVPVMVRPTDPDSVPETLSALNWIDSTGPELDPVLDRIVQALDTDLEYTKAHTRLLVRASDWEHRGEDRSLLLRGDDLKLAEGFLVQAQGKEPTPTPVQARFIQASRQGASRKQRALVSGVSLALVVALVLASFAVVQRSTAQRNEANAEHQQELAERRAAESRSGELGALSLLKVSDDPELALLLAVEAGRTADTSTAETALRSALAASHVEETIQEEGRTTALALSGDGSTLVVGGDPRSDAEGQSAWLKLRSVEDLGGNEVDLAFPTSTGDIADLAVDAHGGLVAVATNQGDVVVLDVASTSVERDAHFPSVLQHAELAFDPDGTRLLVAGEAGVGWLDLRTGRLEDGLSVPASSSGWNDAVVDPAGRRAALGGATGIYLFGLGSDRRPLRIERSEATSLSFDATGSRLAAAVGDAALVWDADTGRLVRRIQTDAALTVALSPDGTTLLTGDANGTATLWSLTTATPIASFVGQRDAIVGAAFDPAGSRVYTSGREGATRVWRVPEGAVPTTTDRVLAMSGDGSVIATYVGGMVSFRDGTSGTPLSSLRPDDLLPGAECLDPSTSTTPNVGLSRDGTFAVEFFGGRCLVAIDVQRGVGLWSEEISEGIEQQAIPDSEAWVSPDGRMILVAGLRLCWGTGGDDGSPGLGGGAEISSEVTGNGLVYGADFSENSQEGYLAGRYGLLGAAAYDLANQTVLCQAQAAGRVNDVTAVPGGGFALATTLGVMVFDEQCVPSGVGELTSRRAPVQAIAFRSDGTVAATVDNAGIIRLWDAASGVLLGTVPAIGELIVFADDDDLLVGGVDGVRRYACDVCGDIGELLARADERLGRQLTPEERATYLHGSGS